MHRKVTTLALAALLLAGCAVREQETTTASGDLASALPDPAGPVAYTGPDLIGRTTGDWDVTVVSDDLVYPWEVRLAGENLVVTELDGTIAMIGAGGRLTRHRVGTSDPVVRDGGSGLMGLALARDFADSGTAYVYYTHATDSGLTNRIAELAFDGDNWTERRVLLDGIPGHQFYNGGRLAVGPDGHLYATTGWVEDDSVSQDRGSLAGKILRLRTDGSIPPDNPDPDSYVYSSGHRNPQGLAWDAEGRLWSAEHGQSGNDEINQIVAGGNYGWPLIEGDEGRDGMRAPHLHSGTNAWAPSGMAFAGDDLLLTALGDQTLYVLNGSDRTLEPVFSSGERARAVLPYRDGVYVTSTNTSPRAAGQSGEADRLLWIRPRS
ncbi:sorbosone dehydrogenase family protein [Actinoplanes sp. DH11]|uniref:PQQ-dependent sugar dehydrogenase n=1 Tax=Actinoplanes sp. DH11 TaxID=2857011 RepID=UPI001E5B7936|nr:PQQ-dependent sugar dehydrogenase [Actinoplanes sp. DH11]